MQLTGADGMPIDASIQRVGGLRELDEIMVVGSVDAASTPVNMIVNAVKIHGPTGKR